jgi:hypothetical protein
VVLVLAAVMFYVSGALNSAVAILFLFVFGMWYVSKEEERE